MEPRDDDNQQLQALRADLRGFLSEEPQPGDRSSAGEWASAYQALTELLERNLQDQHRVVRNLPGPARRYMERANVAILQEELDTFRGRLDYWREQLSTASAPT